MRAIRLSIHPQDAGSPPARESPTMAGRISPPLGETPRGASPRRRFPGIVVGFTRSPQDSPSAATGMGRSVNDLATPESEVAPSWVDKPTLRMGGPNPAPASR